MVKRTRAKRTPKNKKVHMSDAPPAARRTVTTMSTVFPRRTDSVMVHSSATAVFTATPVAVASTAYQFYLSASNATTGNFDQYRIRAVRFSVVPQNNAIGLVTNSTTSLVPLYCVIDYDDATALTTAAQAQGYNNVITLGPGESCSRTFVPRMAIAASAGGVFTSYASTEPMWIDSVSTTVAHFGAKILAPGTIAAQTLLQSWDVTIEYAIEMRNNLA